MSPLIVLSEFLAQFELLVSTVWLLREHRQALDVLPKCCIEGKVSGYHICSSLGVLLFTEIGVGASEFDLLDLIIRKLIV